MEAYKNVMEILVEQEVLRQVNALPARIAAYINQTELLAFALNQLPALYATSERGLEHQLEKGKVKFATQITQSVQRAIAAIRRDPLRSHVPLQVAQDSPHQEVLLRLRRLLRNDKVNWETLPIAVEQALYRATKGESDLDRRRSGRSLHSSPLIHKSSPFATQPAAESNFVSPQQVSPQQVSPHAGGQPTRPSANRRDIAENELFGWDDPLYDSRFPK
jgi:Late competence development protein ComFB